MPAPSTPPRRPAGCRRVRTRVHVRPPPVTVVDWPPLDGPSAATNASSRSSLAWVVMPGVVVVVRPFTVLDVSMVGVVPGGGVAGVVKVASGEVVVPFTVELIDPVVVGGRGRQAGQGLAVVRRTPVGIERRASSRRSWWCRTRPCSTTAGRCPTVTVADVAVRSDAVTAVMTGAVAGGTLIGRTISTPTKLNDVLGRGGGAEVDDRLDRPGVGGAALDPERVTDARVDPLVDLRLAARRACGRSPDSSRCRRRR